MEYLTIAATVSNVIQAISGGENRARQYEAQSQANAYNAAIMRQRAESTRAQYGQREEAQRRRARLALGAQRAASAESGTGLGGSNLDIERQSEVFAELDALNIAYEGQLSAHGYESEAGLEDFKSRAAGGQASYSRRGGLIGAASAILSGAGDYTRVRDRKRAAVAVAGGDRPQIYGLYGGYGSYG